MSKKVKVCYILPFFDEKTDTHLFYNYELIKESAKNLDIFLIIERAKGDPTKLGCKFKVQKLKNPVLRFLELLLIVKLARLRGYSNFYTHYSYFGALASWLITLIFGGKAFYWNRGMPWLFKRGFFEEKVFRFILRHTILATSPVSLAEDYKKIYGVREYRILGNWIDHERYIPQKSKEKYKKDLGLEIEKKYVLFVHHLSERKGADFIAPVAEKFKNENVEFLVAGDGEYFKKLKSEVDNSPPQPPSLKVREGGDKEILSPCGGRVILLGKIPQSEVVKYFHASDVFFMPSREEGSPHVILEAMASGVPFVASNIGGISELTMPEAREFLCGVGDIECFAGKIKKLLNDAELRENIRKNGFEFVRNFSKEKAVKEFSELFEPKIYYVANARFPTEKAHGIQMAKMIEAMIGKGASIEVLAPNRGKGNIKKFYGLRREVLIKRLPVLPFYNFGKIGFWLSSVSFALGYWFFLIWKSLRGEKFIIYTIDIDQFSFFAVPFAGAPYFVEVHDAKKKGFFFNILFKNAKGIIVINNIIKETIAKEFSFAKDKIIVHPNGIDLEKFSNLSPKSEAREKLDLPKREKIALYVGKFYNWKGLGILADTAQKLQDVKFYLVGGSKEELKKVSGIENWAENLVCAGQRDFKEMPLWLASADVLLVLGTKANEYSYKHTSPMKLFEYMASERPIVASRTPAIEQIVSENDVIFYEPDNPESFADSIKHALEGAEGSRNKAQNAHEKVKKFSWEKRAESVLNFIKL
ncbi:MAG: glycosyltransferase [Patescibacteria group bacterium]